MKLLGKIIVILVAALMVAGATLESGPRPESQ